MRQDLCPAFFSLLFFYYSFFILTALLIRTAVDASKQTAPIMTTGAKIIAPSVTPRSTSPTGMMNTSMARREPRSFR